MNAAEARELAGCGSKEKAAHLLAMAQLEAKAEIEDARELIRQYAEDGCYTATFRCLASKAGAVMLVLVSDGFRAKSAPTRARETVVEISWEAA